MIQHFVYTGNVARNGTYYALYIEKRNRELILSQVIFKFPCPNYFFLFFLIIF